MSKSDRDELERMERLTSYECLLSWRKLANALKMVSFLIARNNFSTNIILGEREETKSFGGKEIQSKLGFEMVWSSMLLRIKLA